MSLKKKKGDDAPKVFESVQRLFMIIILIAASIVSGILGDVAEALIIIAIVIINAVLGVIQEGKAEKAIEALKKMSAPSARVLRDGIQKVVPAAELVPGDIVLLEAGDVVPADIRLLESSNLKAEEASLTGESVPVEKFADFTTDEDLGIGDRTNMVFRSTALTYGRARGVVVATAEKTEMGKIADRLKGIVVELTPLQVSLNALGKVLGIVCLIVCADRLCRRVFSRRRGYAAFYDGCQSGRCSDSGRFACRCDDRPRSRHEPHGGETRDRQASSCRRNAGQRRYNLFR